MSHSCVANLEVVDPPSRSIAFRVKRPVSWSLSYFPQCIGIGKNIYCTWNRCILWRSKAWVFESKKWKCGCLKRESATTNCSRIMSLACFAPGKAKKLNLYKCTLLLNLPFPFMRIKNTIINVQVSAGEELTWCYTNVLQPQAATVAKHLDTWMFKCSCPRWWNYHDNMFILEVKLSLEYPCLFVWKYQYSISICEDFQ